MYTVIFRATIRELDKEYTQTATRMRELAITQYGCIDFVSACEGSQEIAISYWPSLEAIAAWKNDPEHQRAQQLGREKWYSTYQVQIAKVERG